MTVATGLRPCQIHLDRADAVVTITWNDGTSARLSGQQLRQYCACSGCRARGLVGTALISDSSRIEALKLIGTAGLQVIFSDGHERGIFPWDYLNAIACGKAMDSVHA
ncbi:DUF971 domain-containing protein [Allohahella marinimesophila]|uniref:DUF971 domain-containing protein n=1 Tax=Allohahella marinimesophila TaxID=1054972 RepID=A0ABP7PFB8_9GAMM